ncbi:hypothetical protein D3C75_833990 [compost metagenome]
MVIRSFTHDQIKQTFLLSSPNNIEVVINYNLFEMPEFIAQQLGKPSVEDVTVWQEWLGQRLDKHSMDVERLWQALEGWKAIQAASEE